MREQPLIFDIRRASTVDGPGLRTTVFFKGCPLNCFWCHNPEGKRREREMAFFSEKCIGCGACQSACKTPEDCVACGACALYCPTQARQCFGRHYTPEELLERILPDLPYYTATGGGVTLSGGECMLYPDFVSDLAKLCQSKGIHVAVDTAGEVPYSHFEAVLPYVNLFLYDVKALDSALHRHGTGVGNERILENLDRLRATGKCILIRVPVIPDFNEGAEIDRIRDYCEERDLPYELLSYHAMGESKADALSRFGRA